MSESACLALEGARAMFGVLLGTSHLNPLVFTEVRMQLVHNLEHGKNGALRNFRFTCKITRGSELYEQAKADVSVFRKDGRWHFVGGNWDHSAQLSKQHSKLRFRWKSLKRNWFERPECTTAKKKILVASIKYSVAEDSSVGIMEILEKNGEFEPELYVCLGTGGMKSMVKKIHTNSYDAIFLVWEWAYDIEELETCVKALHSKFPHLRMIAFSNRPGCCEILRNAGCCDELDTGFHTDVFSELVIEHART